LTITINRDAAARFGIRPQLIDSTLNGAFGQDQVTQYFTNNSYYLILEVLPELQGRLQTLNELYIKAPSNGQLVPLSTLVRVDTAFGRRRGAAGAVDRRFRSVGDRYYRHYSPHRHRQEERHHARRFCHQPRARRAGAARGDQASMFVTVPADRDDDDDSAVKRRRADGRPRRRFRAATTARLFDGRRTRAEPNID